MIIRRILIACLAGVAVVIGGGRTGLADLITIGAAKDNTLYESGTGALSNGAGDYFFAGQTQFAEIRRGLIAFDIAGSIAAGSTINSVTLTLNMSKTNVGDTTVGLHIAGLG